MHEQVNNLNQALLAAMEAFAGRICFHLKRGKRYQNITYERFHRYAFRLAHFFRQQGISNGERVVIIADNPLEWMVVYVACLFAGGVVVPLRAWLSADNLQTMVKDSGACLAVIQGERHLHIIDAARKELPELKTILVVNDISDSYPEVIPLTSILGKTITPEEEAAVRAHAENVPADALALLYYSSTLKGAVFDHARRLAVIHSMGEWFTLNEDDVAMTTVLAWSLPTLNTTLHYFLSGVPHVVTGTRDRDIAQRNPPTVLLTTPSGFEEFYNELVVQMNELPASRRAVFEWALRIGKEYIEAGLEASKELRDAYARADLTLFSQIRGRIGGRLHRLYSTGAPLPEEWAEVAEIVGLLPLNVYSLTEAGGFPAVSHPDARRRNSCGQVAPGFQIRIADDGEVLVRGASLMCAYWKNPQATQQVLDEDGWLHTGDLGRFDQDGFLYLTGHKQPLILLSSGNTVMPTTIEQMLIENPFIDQAVIFGEGRPYISALIVPDLDAVAAYLGQNGHDGSQNRLSATDDIVKRVVSQAVADVNKGLDHWSRVETFQLLNEPLSQQKGELTSSLKICRENVIKHYTDEIEAMYPPAISLRQKEVAPVQLDPSELHELLAKQDLLDAWMADAGIEFLFDLAREKQIDPPSMVHISDTVATIAQMQSEEKPLSTAFIIGDPIHIARHLPESEIQLQRYDHIRRMRQIVATLAKMVDGVVLGYVLDTHGYVRGIHKLLGEMPEDAENFLFGPHFRHHAAISQACNAVVFFVPAGGRQVRVFADGQLVGRYSNGNWSAEKISHIGEAIANLAEQKQYDLGLLRRILRCAFQMSERNWGAIFVVGDADLVLEYSDPPEISPFATILGSDINCLDDRELINFAKQDGATIIDRDCNFRGCMVLLRPDASTQAEIGPGKGARHSSAAKMSAEAECLAITVSQDGPITIYESGQRIISL